MNQSALCLQPHTPFVEALNAMVHDRLGGFIVADADNRLCRIVTTYDVLKVLRLVMRFGRTAAGEGTDCCHPSAPARCVDAQAVQRNTSGLTQ